MKKPSDNRKDIHWTYSNILLNWSNLVSVSFGYFRDVHRWHNSLTFSYQISSQSLAAVTLAFYYLPLLHDHLSQRLLNKKALFPLYPGNRVSLSNHHRVLPGVEKYSGNSSFQDPIGKF